MDCPEEISKLDKKQRCHLSEKGIVLLGREEIKEIQSNDELLTLIPFVNPAYLNEIVNLKALNNVTQAQINVFGSAGYNKLDNKHALWGRITNQALENLNADKIRNIEKCQFQFLKKPDTIRSITKWNLVHLKKTQLVHRKDFSLVYVIGVLTLGVVACLISLIAYFILLPIFILGGAQVKKDINAILLPNVKRPRHLFYEYIPARRLSYREA
jgi:hypothetical protein